MKQKALFNQCSDVKCAYITTFLRGLEILDVGSGQGHYLSWIAQHHKNMKLLAIDQKEPPSCQDFIYQKADLEEPIKLQDNSFSTIFAFDIIEHITNEQQLANQLFRICKPGGILIGSVPHDRDLFLPNYNLTFYHRSDVTHKRYYTKDGLSSLLEKAGFHSINIDGKGGVNPQVIAEFFPKGTQFLIKKIIGGLRRSGIINTNLLTSDLFFTAQKQ